MAFLLSKRELKSALLTLNNPNPTDYISSQSKAAERLFFKGKVFSVLVYGGLGTIILLFCIGIVWEFSCRRQKIEVKRQDQDSHMFSQRSALIGRRLAKTGKERSVWSSEELKELISKYQVFHHQWIEKFKAMKEAGMFQTKDPV